MSGRPRYLLAVISIVVLLAVSSVCLGQAYAPGEVLVKFQPGTPGAAVAAAHRGVGGQTIKTFGTIGVQHIRLGQGVGVPAAVQAYERNPNVVYAEPNYALYADATEPNDAYFGQLWGLHNIGQTGGTPDADIDAPEAWDTATGTTAIVAVIDTGVDYIHEDLAANMWANLGDPPDGVDNDGNGYIDDVYGWDFANDDNDPMDDNGHGSHCSGTIGAVGDNTIGVVGVNWSVRIMALKFLDSGGSGWTSDAVECVLYATMMKQRGEPIVATSNSWGGGGYSQTLKDAIAAAGDEGILFVAAAGNSRRNNDRRPHYPSSYDLDSIIAVAATDDNDALAKFSSYGKNSVDLAAPGVNILSTVPGDAYTYASGTSMATPHVSGAVALVQAYHPGEAALTIKARILASVDPLSALEGRMVSGGRLNLVNALGPPAPPPNDAPTVIITSPADGSSFDSGATISFTGTASDTEDGDLTASLVWTSSIDGPIGTGGSLLTALTDGIHTITATAIDSGGQTGSDSISITVGTPPPPTALIVDVTTDKPSYANRDTVWITVAVSDGIGAVVEGAAVHVVITTYNGRTFRKDGTTDASGVATFKHKVNSRRDGVGTCDVDATASKAPYTDGSGSTTFDVTS